MRLATPRMISQSGLVCLPAAGNAAVGRRVASMKAHTSTTRAASHSASKNQASGVVTPEENTPLGYPLRALYGPRAHDRAAAPVREGRVGCGMRGAGRGPGGIEPDGDPPRWPGGQDLLDRWWLWVLGLPLSAPLRGAVLRPLRAFSPRLASLSYSAAARVRAVVAYPLARLDSVLIEASSRHLASQAVSSRSLSEASTPAPAAACTGLLSASLRISVRTSMVRFITDSLSLA